MNTYKIRRALTLLMIGILLFIQHGCNKESDATPITFEIGQNHGGGIIFYVDATGKHGLIIAPVLSQFKLVRWGCKGENIVNAQNTNIGSGQQNTTAILERCKVANIAAKLCDDLILDGFSDWFLPSKDELNLFYENLLLKGIGDINSGYWSSTQSSPDMAWEHGMAPSSSLAPNGVNSQLTSTKDAENQVRAVRAF